MTVEKGATQRELTVEDFLDELDARFKAEETEGWRTPANRTEREYTARQARMAVEELRHKIAQYNAAVAGATVCPDCAQPIVECQAEALL